MAVLFMDSFNHYVTADITEKWTMVQESGGATTSTIETASGRRSSGCFRFKTGTIANPIGYINKVVPNTSDTCIFGVAISISRTLTSPINIGIIYVRELGTGHITFRLNHDHTLSLMRGGLGGSLLGTTSASLGTGIFVYVEAKIKINNTTGTIDIYFDGANVLSLTGQDTQNAGNPTWNNIILGSLEATGGTNESPGRNIDYDDFYLSDNTGAAPWNGVLGDCRVDPRYSTGAGANTGWTPLSGSNWDNVNETSPDHDTTYNSAATAALKDTYVFEDAPVVGATIYAIQHNLSMKKTDAGTCTVGGIVRHSGTDNINAGLYPRTSYSTLTQVNQVNPGTAAAWVEADFNAAEFGPNRLT